VSLSAGFFTLALHGGSQRLKLGEIQPFQKIGIKSLGAVKHATGGGGGEPWERRRGMP
jgi:hypothetical protein